MCEFVNGLPCRLYHYSTIEHIVIRHTIEHQLSPEDINMNDRKANKCVKTVFQTNPQQHTNAFWKAIPMNFTLKFSTSVCVCLCITCRVIIYRSLLGTLIITYLTCVVFMILNSEAKVIFGRPKYPTLINSERIEKNIFWLANNNVSISFDFCIMY